MTDSDIDRASGFVLYGLMTTVVAMALAFVWWMSPFGFGFMRWPDEPQRSVVVAVYRASYLPGIPLLFAAQGLAFVFALFRKRRLAFATPAVALTLFVGAMVFVMAQLK